MASKKGDLTAVMANTVAEARHALSVPEQRLILWLIAQIDREDDALREHSLSVHQFNEILGSNNGRLYDQMEAACRQLQTRVLEIRTGPSERVTFNWMHRVRYLDEECRIILRFHDDLRPVLLQLRERFCQIPIKAVFQLRSGYAIRWLEMLHSRKYLGSFFITVEEVRDWLHIAPDELQKVNHLHDRAIDYPRKDLDKKSPLTFTAQPRREGRKICGWTITILENKPKPARPKAKKLRKPKASPPAPAPVDPAIMDALHEFKASLAPGKPLLDA